MFLKIGYQGTVGSYSEKAAKVLAHSAKLEDYTLVPLLSSSSVISSLKGGEIDYAVVAVRNTSAGPVAETEAALQGGRFAVIESTTMRIRHSIFLHSDKVSPDEVLEIKSHEQALRQCSANIERFFPKAVKVPIEDTAIGAARLARGEYESNVAIVCSRDTGESLGLHLFKEGIEDSPDNKTEFVLMKAISPASSAMSRESVATWIAMKAVTKDTLSIVTKVLVVVTILAGVLAKDLLGFSSLRAALTIGGFASVVFLLLTSNKLQNWLQFRTIKGYWKYSLHPDADKPLVAQHHDVPRVVCIDDGDSGLRIQGWLCTNPVVPWFESNQVLLSPFGTKTGRLVYWYTNVHDATKESLLGGVVSLAWAKNHSNELLTSMAGWYVGRLTGDSGVIRYERIPKDEFDRIVTKRQYGER